MATDDDLRDKLTKAYMAGHDQDCHETECPTCREVTPAPDAHRCGRTPQGRLPANQPHMPATVNAPPDLLETWSLIKKALKPYAEVMKAIQRAANKPDTQDDYTLAGPSEGD